MSSLNSIEKQSRFQNTLVDCVQTLYINENIDDAINKLLAIIADYYNADRCYIFEFTEDMQMCCNTYEWCAENITPEIEMLREVPVATISRWLDFFREKGEFYINSLGSEVSEDSAEYKLLNMQGIQSLMAAPLHDSGRLVGFMGVDNPRENSDQLLLMRLVSAFVVNDIQKRETLEQRILRAIGDTYVSINMVDFAEDTQVEIKRNHAVAKYVFKPHDATRQMISVMTGLTSSEYLQSALEFTDLTTAQKRLADVDILSHEFLSFNSHWCRCSFIVMNRREDGLPADALFAVQYIDAEKQKELDYQRALKRALENQNEIYAEMLHFQGCAVIAARTEDEKVIVMNGAAQEMFGVHEEGGLLSEVLRSVASDSFGKVMEKLEGIRREPGECSLEFALTSAGGRQYYVKSSARTVTLGGGDSIMILTLMDITDKKKLENRLMVLSETDALTRIRNRGSGEHMVEELISRGTVGMFCLLDVDKFKSINDNFGHTIGDKALIAIADSLRSSFDGDGDIVMRLGGDEFAAFAVGVQDEEQGTERIRRLISAVDAVRIPEMCGRGISISLGAVLCRDSSIPFDKLYPMADSAMYICKKTEGSQFGFYYG